MSNDIFFTCVTFQEVAAPAKLPNSHLHKLFMMLYWVKSQINNQQLFCQLAIYSKDAQGLSVLLVMAVSSRPNNFIEGILETVKQSCLRSCGTELTRQGILLPQDRQEYGRRLIKLTTIIVYCYRRAEVRLYTSSFKLAKSYVFEKQPLLNYVHNWLSLYRGDR